MGAGQTRTRPMAFGRRRRAGSSGCMRDPDSDLGDDLVLYTRRVSRSLISAIGSELYKQCVSSNAYQDSSQKIKNAYQDSRADGRHQDNYKTAESCSTASV